jgi:4'-phosphopantetheinyl transferase
LDRPVGIDIEHVVPRERELHSALAGGAEWELMGDRSWRSFFRLWTAKEATLKANGTGISGLSACRLVEVRDEDHLALDYGGRTWHIEHFYHAGHIAAVTCGREGVKWSVLD